jgi:hypothetical protein
MAGENWVLPWEGYDQLNRADILSGRVALNDVISPWSIANCAVASIAADQFLGGGRFWPVPPFAADEVVVAPEDRAHTLPSLTGGQLDSVLCEAPHRWIGYGHPPLQREQILSIVENAIERNHRGIVALTPAKGDGHVVALVNIDGELLIFDLANRYIGRDWNRCVAKGHILGAKLWSTGPIAADIDGSNLVMSGDTGINNLRPFRVRVAGSVRSRGAWSMDQAREIAQQLNTDVKPLVLERRASPYSWRPVGTIGRAGVVLSS